MSTDISVIRDAISNHIECKFLKDDRVNWLKCLSSVSHDKYVPLAYKPSFIEYQKAYFSDVYDEYEDFSIVLYRGGVPVGIWPICAYVKDGVFYLGSLGMSIIEPLFSQLPKAEARRNVIQTLIETIFVIIENVENACDSAITQVVSMDQGTGEWQKKWMELGGETKAVSYWAYADLFLAQEEIQSRIRRTNKYSIAKGQNDYDIEIYDQDGPQLEKIFNEFHDMHRKISGRETRNQITWDIQKRSIRENSEETGYDFVIFIRDKETKELAGSALFASTPQTGLYCVAAYDRCRFSKPVGHIVQAIAMDYMRKKGIRWYEIGERSYPSDKGVNKKLINIGKYKEGFATNIFPKITIELKRNIYMHEDEKL